MHELWHPLSTTDMHLNHRTNTHFDQRLDKITGRKANGRYATLDTAKPHCATLKVGATASSQRYLTNRLKRPQPI